MKLKDFLAVCRMPRIKIFCFNLLDEDIPDTRNMYEFNYGCEKCSSKEILRDEILASEVTNITITNGLLAVTTELTQKDSDGEK